LTDEKPWYLSRTIWASLVTILAAVAGMGGLAIETTDQSLLTDSILQIVTAIAGLVGIYGRLRATTMIR
jgi:hypothetical protein